MLSVTYSTSTGATQAGPLVTGTTVNGADGAYFVFSPTCRDLTATSGVGSVTQMAQRTSTTCFMRGFAEQLRIQTSSGVPWFHRRICFCTRDPLFRDQTVSGAVAAYAPYYDDTTRGLTRLWLNSANNNTASLVTLQLGVLFKGRYNYDWNDRITALVDTTRVDLKFDKTWIYRSGNANGITKETKLWHSMNKNLTYDDDESGDQEATVYYSVEDKRGMGDYYVIDIVQAGEGAASTDLMRINNTSSLYWHEK